MLTLTPIIWEFMNWPRNNLVAVGPTPKSAMLQSEKLLGVTGHRYVVSQHLSTPHISIGFITKCMDRNEMYGVVIEIAISANLILSAPILIPNG